MHLNWSKSWKDIVEEVNQILPLCEARLSVLPPDAQQKSKEALYGVRRQLTQSPSFVRREAQKWNGAIQLAYDAVKIAKRMPKREVGEREVAKKLANFGGIEFGYLRRSDSSRENFFRDSLESFLEASLPDLVPTAIAADILDDIPNWLQSYYKPVPKDISFKMNDIVLTAYEAHRRQLDADETHGLMIGFVEVNRDLIGLPVSEASERVRERWEKIYREHIGEPPQLPKRKLVDVEVRARLKDAGKTNDPMAVRDVLAPLETGLTEVVKTALDVSFDFREPRREVRDASNRSSPEFEAALRQIRQQNRKATQSFEQIWKDQTHNVIAKEWYGFALAKLEDSWRQAKEHFVEIRKEGRGDQITDWNLACCELKLGNRQAALNILRERVDSAAYIDDVLEGAIFLALELGEKRFLSEQLDWLPCEEAILLGYLFAADSLTPRDELEKWLSSIEVIASDARGFEPPHPAEEISPRDLDNLCFAFNRRRMLRGGITWFRRRVSFKDHEYIYLNWRLLGDLSLQAGLSDEAVRCYSRSLNCTSKARVNPEIKQQSVNEILNVLCQKNLIEAAGETLAKYSGLLSPVDIRRWQQITKTIIEPAQEPDRKSPEEHREVERETEPSPPQDPQLRLAQINNQLLKVRRLAALKGDFSLFREGADTLAKISPAYSRKLVEQLHITIQSLQNFDSSSNLKDKERFGQELRDNTAELSTVLQGVTEPQLKVNAEDLLTVLRNLGKEATFQTSVIRDIEIDWRLNGYLPHKTLPPVSPELPKTCLLLQITNRGTEKVAEVNVHLVNVSGRVTVTAGIQRLDIPLEPGASAVLRFPLDYDSFEGEEHFSAHVTFNSGGVTGLQTRPTPFSIYAKSFSENLRGQELIRDAFFTGVGIPEDRRDVFHGREREQKRIANSLRGNVQSEVLFLNGPRRVGKTSILNSLKWALPELDLKQHICVDLGEEIPSNTAEYLQAIAGEIVKAVNKHLNVEGYLKQPPPEEFKSEPIAAFKCFCEITQQKLAQHRVVIMIDETQRLAQAVKTGRLDDNVLSLFSTLMSRNTGIMFIFTASVLFRDVKDLSSNPIWGRLVPFAVGFLNSDAVSQVLEAGVVPFPVKFTREAINRVWQMTEGHPWIVQAIGKRIVNDVLNPQRRLTVGPSDVDQIVEFIEKYENQYCSFWWNERKEEGGFVDETDWAIAKVIIDQQERPGMGITKSLLFRSVTQQAIPINNERINKLVDMQTLVKASRNNEDHVRIKGLFLERWLKDQIDARQVLVAKANVALFVDHENVSISLQKYIEQLSAPKQSAWSHTRDPLILARKLAQNAERHGTVVFRMAVATWGLFAKDLQPYAQAMFAFDQPLGGKNTSDEKIKQLVRDTLEQKPEVGIYIVATGDEDYRDTIQTLLKRNKRVILWGFRAVGTVRSNMAASFREMESWQNLTIEYLDDILLREIPPKPPVTT